MPAGNAAVLSKSSTARSLQAARQCVTLPTALCAQQQCSRAHTVQCSAQHQGVRHHTESTDGAARHAGCRGSMRPRVTAHMRRQGSVGQVRECAGPAMEPHTYTQRAHNRHIPARLPLPLGRHPGHCLLVTAPSAQHNTTQHNTTQHNTPQHNTTQHNTTQHNTSQHNTTQHNTTQHNTTQHNTTNTTQHNTTQHNTTQHNTTQHNRTLHNTTQHNTTQHNTTQHNTTQHNKTHRAYSCRAEPGAGGPRPLALSELRARRRTSMPSGVCGSPSVADTYRNACWRRPCTWRGAAPQSSSWPRPNPRQALRIPLYQTTPGTSCCPPMERRRHASTCMSAPGLPPGPPCSEARKTRKPSSWRC